ncbi:hypothetical protein SGA02_24030 [Staphylococcus gallinarum]|uniref:Uncharacterized protein n=1 Tax=Staphylococcus gallinarum TaxID=1293 RepID=A0ABQ0Y5A8_STAGA|nr:hypothetical protein SGA02_24030 [Staphylococcus gallinarum]
MKSHNRSGKTFYLLHYFGFYFCDKKDTTKELKRITSAIIGKDDRDITEIMNNVGNAYGIRYALIYVLIESMETV